ncbi:DUF4276 family protein [Geofilum rubicundum]|uniref:DUF4276 family protein n=1 Tax=Geofilum rubicundum JCM 15548 TaxID=1236989 RepID=A0A0E9LQY7_9BACT|nr:DUF4276 family protein [Geofilum rubicundum]GAO27713.1 hypothetical protein JCM15548_14560 [Geofilum rubicundum JCM 15548]
MKRVIIICEGETEREFCSTILAPYFAKKDIFIQGPLIKKTMGGIVKWVELKKQISLHLSNDSKAFVTTLIDYYGLYSKYNFPLWDEAEKQPDKNLRMKILERGMLDSIDDALRFRFIPYLQLHEFEGLLFNEIEVFYEQIPKNELIGVEELAQTFQQFSNPEMINNSKETSPSHRLKRIILGYNKIVYGNILAEAIGIEKMKSKSPRFNEWLNMIEKI